MTSMVIRTACRVFRHPCERVFDDRIPVVIAYCFGMADDRSEEGLPQQIRDIRAMLADTCGTRGSNIVWIMDESGAGLPFPNPHTEYRAGLHLAAELIRQGLSSTLAVQRTDRVTESIGNWFRFCDDIIATHSVEMLIAKKPPAGSHPDVEYLDWLIRFDAGQAAAEDHPHIRSHVDAGEPEIGPTATHRPGAKTRRSGCQTGKDGGPGGSRDAAKGPDLSSDDGPMFVQGSVLVMFDKHIIWVTRRKGGLNPWIS